MADGEGKGATARPAGNAATEGKQSRGIAGKRRGSSESAGKHRESGKQAMEAEKGKGRGFDRAPVMSCE